MLAEKEFDKLFLLYMFQVYSIIILHLDKYKMITIMGPVTIDHQTVDSLHLFPSPTTPFPSGNH